MAVKKFIDVGAGVVDADYRGPVGVVLFNFGDKDFEVEVGDRVAQLVLERIDMADAVEVDDLEDTERGAGGFGSTGVSAAAASSPSFPPLVVSKRPRSLSPEPDASAEIVAASDSPGSNNGNNVSVSNTLAFQPTVAELLAIVYGMEQIRLAPEAFRREVKGLALTKDPRLVAAVAAYGVTEDAADFMETLEIILAK